MKILLDTHIAIWAILNDKRLKGRARKLITNPYNIIYFSAISALEVDIKKKGKNDNLNFSLDEFISMCRNTDFTPLPLSDAAISEANHLVWEGAGNEHKDPFDRMLLAQAIVEGMHFMTSDKKISYFKQDCVILI